MAEGDGSELDIEEAIALAPFTKPFGRPTRQSF
jgi:hypothetical protein